MNRSRPLALLLLIATFALAALPAASFAQSAGDNQYQDPLGGGGGGSTPPPKTPAPSSHSRSGSQQPRSAGAAVSTPSPPAAGGRRSSANVPLAHTGFSAWVPALAGVLLLAGGTALLLAPGRRARRR